MPDARQRPALAGVAPARVDAAGRVLDAAVDLVRERGLTVALDRIGLEEAIAASGVARATAYRRWPSREGFQQQVLLRVVADAHLDVGGDQDVSALRTVLRARRDVLGSASGRRTLVVEALRLATERDLRRLLGSRAWRDHLALRATCASLPAGELREAVAAALADAERAFTDRRAAVYAVLADVLGYRLVPWLGGDAGYALMSQAAGAVVAGLAARAGVVEAGPPVRAAAFGSAVEATWSPEAYAVVATVLAYLEPDPAAVWDDARVERALARARDLMDLTEPGRSG